jgi:hypothetical protein
VHVLEAIGDWFNVLLNNYLQLTTREGGSQLIKQVAEMVWRYRDQGFGKGEKRAYWHKLNLREIAVEILDAAEQGLGELWSDWEKMGFPVNVNEGGPWLYDAS